MYFRISVIIYTNWKNFVSVCTFNSYNLSRAICNISQQTISAQCIIHFLVYVCEFFFSCFLLPNLMLNLCFINHSPFRYNELYFWVHLIFFSLPSTFNAKTLLLGVYLMKEQTQRKYHTTTITLILKIERKIWNI